MATFRGTVACRTVEQTSGRVVVFLSHRLGSYLAARPAANRNGACGGSDHEAPRRFATSDSYLHKDAERCHHQYTDAQPA